MPTDTHDGSWTPLRHRGPCTRAFTLLELLVVIAIVAVLISILLPSVKDAREAALNAVCLSNLRHLGGAYHMYTTDNIDEIPGGDSELANGPNHWRGRIAPYLGIEITSTSNPPLNSAAKILYCSEGFDTMRDDELSSYKKIPWSWGYGTYGMNRFLVPNQSPQMPARHADEGYPTLKRSDIFNEASTIIYGDLGPSARSDTLRALVVYHTSGGESAIPRLDQIVRHRGRGNYVFGDGHAEGVDYDLIWTLDYSIWPSPPPGSSIARYIIPTYD